MLRRLYGMFNGGKLFGAHRHTEQQLTDFSLNAAADIDVNVSLVYLFDLIYLDGLHLNQVQAETKDAQ